MEHQLAEQKAELEEIRRRGEEEFELERRRHEQDLAQMQQKLTRMEDSSGSNSGSSSSRTTS